MKKRSNLKMKKRENEMDMGVYTYVVSTFRKQFMHAIEVNKDIDIDIFFSREYTSGTIGEVKVKA